MKRLLLITTCLAGPLMITPQPVSADPITAAVAALSTAFMGPAALTFFGTGLTGMGAAFAHFAMRAALGYALNALSAKASSRAGRGYTVNSIGAALPHAVIYGQAKVGGAVFYQTTTGASPNYLHRCIAFAGHEIDSFTTFYLNDEALTLDGSGNVTAPAQYVGLVRIKGHTGTATQAADSDLVAEVTEWTTAHQAKGIAYAYARYKYDATAFPNGVPTLTALIKGKKCYNPASGLTEWTANPSLCLRDYLTSDYGLGATSDEINETAALTATTICAADHFGVTRYTCNGAFLLDAGPADIVSGLLSSMGGMFWYAQGQWNWKAAAYTEPVALLDLNDVRGEIQIATRNSRRDNFNTVHGVYRGSETNWQESDYPEITSATYIAEDGGAIVETELPLLFTDTAEMAQRIATIALERNRRQLSVTAPFGLSALAVGIGDTINLRWAADAEYKVFEVLDWRFGLTGEMDLQVNMLLRELDADVFGAWPS